MPIIYDFKISSITEEIDQVVVTSNNGHREVGSFVIGCDGIHSATRANVLKAHGLPFEPEDFTGLIQVRSPFTYILSII